MADFDALERGLKLFNSGMTQLGVTRAMNQAHEQVQQINSMTVDEMEKRKQLGALAQGLTLQMTGVGADPQQIQQAYTAIAPKGIADAKDAFYQGQITGDKGLQELAQKGQTFEEAPKVNLAQIENASKERIARIGSDPNGFKAQKADNDLLMKFSQELDPNRARTGEFGKNQSRLNAAGRVKALYDATGGNPNNINMRELATSVGTMLTTGSQIAVSQIDELVPHTMSGDSAKIQEWLTSNPTGSGQQKFAAMYKDIAEREAGIAKDQMKIASYQKMAGFQKVKDKMPGEYDAVLQANPLGLSHAEYEHFKKTRTLMPPPDANQKARDWIAANPNDPRAAKIKAQLGIK